MVKPVSHRILSSVSKSEVGSHAVRLTQHTVKPGESFAVIAGRYGASEHQLRQANPRIMRPDMAFAGDQLNIPYSRAYTIKHGDTLGGIANQFGSSAEIIAELNDLTKQHSLSPGELLLLPANTAQNGSVRDLEVAQGEGVDRKFVPIGSGKGMFKEFPTPGGGKIWVSDAPITANDVRNILDTLPPGTEVDIFSGTHGTQGGFFAEQGYFGSTSDGGKFFYEDLAAAGAYKQLKVVVHDVWRDPGALNNLTGFYNKHSVNSDFMMSGGALRDSIHSSRTCIMGWCYSEKNPEIFLNYNAP